MHLHYQLESAHMVSAHALGLRKCHLRFIPAGLPPALSHVPESVKRWHVPRLWMPEIHSTEQLARRLCDVWRVIVLYGGP